MRDLYPVIEPYHSFFLETESIHRIYVEESGNAQGNPVIFLHGGPGSGSNPNHRRYFNPEKYRIINFDQRGCNRSTPQGEVKDNTTDLILEDMESVRKQLEIERWVLFGGSWGSTLALLYAQKFPDKVSGMILRGSFLARQQDLDWFIRSGVNRFFPDAWNELIKVIPEEHRDDLISAFHHCVHDGDEKTRLDAARSWSNWCTKIVTWNLVKTGTANGTDSDKTVTSQEENDKVLNEVSIETHFALNRYFISENQILDNIHLLPNVPVHIIHGRQDITCLPESSWSLHQGIPASTLEFLPDAGHLAGEAKMIDALVSATDRFSEMSG